MRQIPPSGRGEHVLWSEPGAAQELNPVDFTAFPQEHGHKRHCGAQGEGGLLRQEQMRQTPGLSPRQTVVKHDSGEKSEPDLEGDPGAFADNSRAWPEAEYIQADNKHKLGAENPEFAGNVPQSRPADQEKDGFASRANSHQKPGTGKQSKAGQSGSDEQLEPGPEKGGRARGRKVVVNGISWRGQDGLPEYVYGCRRSQPR